MQPKPPVPAPSQFRRTLVELCADRHLQDVSVTDLCRAASLSRKTFYIYFDGVQAVALGCFDEELRPIAESLSDDLLVGPREGQAMAHWVAGVAARRQQLITLHTAFGRDPLRIAAEPLIRDVVERLWKLQGVPPGPDREYAVSAATGVTLAVTNTWIARGFEEDAAHVTKVLATLLTPGSERFYSRYRTAK